MVCIVSFSCEIHHLFTYLFSGSVAVHLGKKSEEYSTHRWKLYIRGPNYEDLSTFIDKVAFTLHPSFAEPVRGKLRPCKLPIETIVANTHFCRGEESTV